MQVCRVLEQRSFQAGRRNIDLRFFQALETLLMVQVEELVSTLNNCRDHTRHHLAPTGPPSSLVGVGVVQLWAFQLIDES